MKTTRGKENEKSHDMLITKKKSNKEETSLLPHRQAANRDSPLASTTPTGNSHK